MNKPSRPYTSVCDKCGLKTWYEVAPGTTQPCHACPKGRLHAFDLSQLDSRFTPYYESGERVEVTYKTPSGDTWKKSFWVGKSLGWRPIYLEIKTTRSMSGGSIMSEYVESIRGTGRFNASQGNH